MSFHDRSTSYVCRYLPMGRHFEGWNLVSTSKKSPLRRKGDEDHRRHA